MGASLGVRKELLIHVYVHISLVKCNRFSLGTYVTGYLPFDNELKSTRPRQWEK